MNENNLKVKATSKVKAVSNDNVVAFDQRKFISDIYECEKQLYILDARLRELLVLLIFQKILRNLFNIKIIVKNTRRKNLFLKSRKSLIYSIGWYGCLCLLSAVLVLAQ